MAAYVEFDTKTGSFKAGASYTQEKNGKSTEVAIGTMGFSEEESNKTTYEVNTSDGAVQTDDGKKKTKDETVSYGPVSKDVNSSKVSIKNGIKIGLGLLGVETDFGLETEKSDEVKKENSSDNTSQKTTEDKTTKRTDESEI